MTTSPAKISWIAPIVKHYIGKLILLRYCIDDQMLYWTDNFQQKLRVFYIKKSSSLPPKSKHKIYSFANRVNDSYFSKKKLVSIIRSFAVYFAVMTMTLPFWWRCQGHKSPTAIQPLYDSIFCKHHFFVLFDSSLPFNRNSFAQTGNGFWGTLIQSMFLFSFIKTR